MTAASRATVAYWAATEQAAPKSQDSATVKLALMAFNVHPVWAASLGMTAANRVTAARRAVME